MNQDHRPLIHIGYHKTGTSWVQRHVFSNTALGFAASVSNKDMIRRIVEPHPLDFDAPSCQAFFAPHLHAAREADRTLVVSRERFSGKVYFGAEDSKDLASRLRAVFPDGRVLIVIREQYKVLVSIYGQYVKESGVWSLADFLQPPKAYGRPAKFGAFRLEHYRYDRLIRWYMDLFGAPNVLVLPYEQFVATPRAFVGAIVRFCDIPDREAAIASLPYDLRENPTLSNISLAIQRRLNWLVGERTPLAPTVVFPTRFGRKPAQRLLVRLDRRLPAALKAASRRRLVDEVARSVGRYYADSNRVTAELTSLDLAHYGYMIGGDQ